METQQRSAALEALTPPQAAQLIGQVQGMLDSVTEDAESAADGAIRAQLEALVIGYRLGTIPLSYIMGTLHV